MTNSGFSIINKNPARRVFCRIGTFGELSYPMNKNPAKQDSPPAAGRFSDILLLRRSAILPGELSYPIKKEL
jgi:hypothetical protein